MVLQAFRRVRFSSRQREAGSRERLPSKSGESKKAHPGGRAVLGVIAKRGEKRRRIRVANLVSGRRLAETFSRQTGRDSRGISLLCARGIFRVVFPCRERGRGGFGLTSSRNVLAFFGLSSWTLIGEKKSGGIRTEGARLCDLLAR